MNSKSKAQQVFGEHAPQYASSSVHVRDDSLDIIEEFLGDTKYNITMDIGTGAGFTALSLSKFSTLVIASDPTSQMLQQAYNAYSNKNIKNISIVQNIAEQIPIKDGIVDLITCRKAGHHFPNFKSYLEESHRILRNNGTLIIADSVSPEDLEAEKWLNDIELQRDLSHIYNRTPTNIKNLLQNAGFQLQCEKTTRIYLQFNNWVARTGVNTQNINSLKQQFTEASTSIKEHFQIQNSDNDISFSWPCLVVKCAKMTKTTR
jgi:ubiquinone/menaquinone biosynthesis C-methylase UbiE